VQELEMIYIGKKKLGEMNEMKFFNGFLEA
jgi:hypothetical protein